MILHALELTHVGRFRETVRLGPFGPGLNLLAAPNESGKSTALQACARALFDRHTTRSEEIKALQPVGSALAPGVVVDFATRAGRHRIAKTFLTKPESRLYQWGAGAWELVADADAADQRLQALLQSSLPGRGATKPEHWGFLGFLWARQGEPTAWPSLETAGVGERIRARLARVELDPAVERLRARLAGVAGKIFTDTGKALAGGPLHLAEQELAQIETALAELQRTRAALEDTQRRHQQAEAEVVRLEREQTERAAIAATLRDQALAAERLRGELDARRLALQGAREKLLTATTDAETLLGLQREATTVQAALAQAQAAATAVEQTLTGRRQTLEKALAELPLQEATLQRLRREHQRRQSLLKLRELRAQAEALDRQGRAAEEATAAVATLEDKRSRLPTLTPAQLRKLEERDEAVRTLRAQLQALGLTVELTPEAAAGLTVTDPATPGAPAAQTLAAGETCRLQSPSTLDLRLAGWGRIVIRSGSQDAQTAATGLAQAEAALAEALQQAGVPHLLAAREALVARKELDAQLKAASAALAPHLGAHASLEALRAVALAAVRRADALGETLAPEAAELALSLTDLEAAEATAAEAVAAAEKALTGFQQDLAQHRTEERAALHQAQEAGTRVRDHEGRQRLLETQMRDLLARYPEGLEPARTAAQVAFAQAEARVVATERELPPEFEKLPERNRRAAALLEQIAQELQARRRDRDQAQAILQTLGGQGLYSRETELEERRVEVLRRGDAARAQGWAARVAHDLIEHRKQAATKSVLTPLEDRLSGAFAELTGEADRRVFLDEQLQIVGLGRRRDEVHAFEQLSQGAKEQLLLCLRLAVAQELAAEEPQVLILDDVLVNTDPARQERILEVLEAQARTLQILILTCHPDRYRSATTAQRVSLG